MKGFGSASKYIGANKPKTRKKRKHMTSETKAKIRATRKSRKKIGATYQGAHEEPDHINDEGHLMRFNYSTRKYVVIERDYWKHHKARD